MLPKACIQVRCQANSLGLPMPGAQAEQGMRPRSARTTCQNQKTIYALLPQARAALADLTQPGSLPKHGQKHP